MQRHELDRILSRMLEGHGPVSDLNFTAGRPPQVELHGELVPAATDPPLPRLTPFQTEAIALALIGSDRRLTETLVRTGSCDLPYALGSTARFRVNIFQQRGCYSIVLRRLAGEIPTVEKMGLPTVLHKMAGERNGLILVTGATGSGKSTTLATMLNIINEEKAVHVVTLEDPVEFLHPQKKATFNQRELGTDFDTFAGGLRAALRQAPKVILVGEMRDAETINIALEASETGHLVFSTLHTIDASKTVDRIVGVFPKNEERQIRTRFSQSFRWIVSQRLIPKEGGGRMAVCEILRSSSRTKEYIQEGEREGKSLIDAMNAGVLEGMQTFDYELERLINAGVVDREVGLSYATNRTNLQLRLDTQGGTDEGPPIPAAAAPARKAPAPAPRNEMDDLIER
jgi:twitching motility protein PilT